MHDVYSSNVSLFWFLVLSCLVQTGLTLRASVPSTTPGVLSHIGCLQEANKQINKVSFQSVVGCWGTRRYVSHWARAPRFCHRQREWGHLMETHCPRCPRRWPQKACRFGLAWQWRGGKDRAIWLTSQAKRFCLNFIICLVLYIFHLYWK